MGKGLGKEVGGGDAVWPAGVAHLPLALPIVPRLHGVKEAVARCGERSVRLAGTGRRRHDTIDKGRGRGRGGRSGSENGPGTPGPFPSSALTDTYPAAPDLAAVLGPAVASSAVAKRARTDS